MDKKPRIVIVDDNPHARKAISAYLSTINGLKVVYEASNAGDALKQIESQSPDVVLMDIQMPVMDGLEATQIIKKRWPGIKVIILTLYADYQSRAEQAGADAFLIKGCPMQEVSSAIHSCN